jgi:hypothetical protein
MKDLYMKSALYLVGLLYIFFAGAAVVNASPANPQKAANNPQVVAYYESSSHTVIQPDMSIEYDQWGDDLVMKAGKSGTFQQWYVGPDGEKVHSVWKNIGSSTECPESWLLIVNPYQPPTGDTWGYHFPNGDNYCVKSN